MHEYFTEVLRVSLFVLCSFLLCDIYKRVRAVFAVHRERIDSIDAGDIAQVQYEPRDVFASIIAQPDEAFNIKTAIAHMRAYNRLTRFFFFVKLTVDRRLQMA